MKKGDAFVRTVSQGPLTLMLVNSVEDSNDHMDFCQVTWYTYDNNKLNVQRRFPMAAIDGTFSGFASISQRTFNKARKAMRQNDAESIAKLHQLGGEIDNEKQKHLVSD